ncbi:hypothetical protein [Streptomyces sp. NPDC014806]
MLLHAVLTLVRLGGYVLLLARAGHVLGRATGVVLIGFGLVITVR